MGHDIAGIQTGTAGKHLPAVRAEGPARHPAPKPAPKASAKHVLPKTFRSDAASGAGAVTRPKATTRRATPIVQHEPIVVAKRGATAKPVREPRVASGPVAAGVPASRRIAASAPGRAHRSPRAESAPARHPSGSADAARAIGPLLNRGPAAVRASTSTAATAARLARLGPGTSAAIAGYDTVQAFRHDRQVTHRVRNTAARGAGGVATAFYGAQLLGGYGAAFGPGGALAGAIIGGLAGGFLGSNAAGIVENGAEAVVAGAAKGAKSIAKSIGGLFR